MSHFRQSSETALLGGEFKVVRVLELDKGVLAELCDCANLTCAPPETQHYKQHKGWRDGSVSERSVYHKGVGFNGDHSSGSCDRGSLITENGKADPVGQDQERL